MTLSGEDLRRTLAGAAAAFVGVGLARFSFNPLFPAMVEAGWIEPAGGAYLGAWNLLGYLIGVLGGLALSYRAGTARALDLAMGLTALTFVACAANLGLAWFCAWRLLAGVGGGVLMVLAGPAVQAAVSPRARGLVGGAVIAGVGAGVVLGAVAVPALAAFGPSRAWLALAALILGLWGLAFRHWPRARLLPPPPGPIPARVRQLALAYGVSGAGLVPHMVYLSDLVVRGQGLPALAAVGAWGLFGLGGILGTLAGGKMVDRGGGLTTTRIWLGLQLVGVLLLFSPGPAGLALAGLIGGFAGLGLTGVVLGYTRELVGEASAGSWRLATAGFAVLQTLGSFALAALFAATGDHAAVVAAGLALSALALAVMLLPAGKRG